MDDHQESTDQFISSVPLGRVWQLGLDIPVACIMRVERWLEIGHVDHVDSGSFQELFHPDRALVKADQQLRDCQ